MSKEVRMENKKEIEYSNKIVNVLGELFNEENENFINPEELAEDVNLTHFVHALVNLAPWYAYTKLTGNESNLLEFNHLANRLCFQYINK